ncbi:glycosyltransferase family 39 protein, partial [Agarivorans sp.]|uniref:glycosyltransferase family 39 protein n=1 Tax=Agarivorans sp. TaxID=1872412 RepID=UPI003D024C8B
GWSLTPDWGYYSKPPMVAWFIWLSTHVFGVSEFSTKLPAPLLYLATAYIIQLTTEKLSTPKAGIWAFAIFILSPFVTLNSWFVTTDAPLIFFWSLTVLFFILADQTDKTRYWLLAGIFGGLGLLSKYTMILLPAAIFFMYLFTHQYHRLIKWKFWLTIVIALLVFSPNVIWQALNGFPSFIHTAELANKPGWDGNPHEFIPGQLIVFGPVALIVLITTLGKRFRNQYPTVWYCTWTPLFIFSLKSFQGEAFVNWAAFAYASGAILSGIAISTMKSWIKISHLALSILVAVTFYHYPIIQKTLNIVPSTTNTPYARIEGWRELSQQVAAVAQQNPAAYVASNSRMVNAYLSYYLPESIQKLRTLNPDNHISNHYELFYLLKDEERPVIWLSERELTQHPINPVLPPPSLLTKLEQPVYSSNVRTLWVYTIE